MNKSEIIQALADVTIPEGTTLTERTTSSGFTVARIGQGQIDGLKIMEARIFAESLARETSTLPDEPDGVFFETLHRAVIGFHQRMVNALIIEELKVESGEDYRKVVTRLRQIARDLGISYVEPKDPLIE